MLLLLPVPVYHMQRVVAGKVFFLVTECTWVSNTGVFKSLKVVSYFGCFRFDFTLLK